MLPNLRQKKFYRPEISEVDREIKDVSREIKQLEGTLRKMKKEVEPPPPPKPKAGKKPDERVSEDRKRFASYLSTGSFQTIREYKFKSDIIRKRRLIWAGTIIAIIAIIFILVRYL